MIPAQTQSHIIRLVVIISGFLLLGGPSCLAESDEPTQTRDIFTIDNNGYLIFCLCMGRFGNQAEHFLGGLAFAKAVNRTLILPPWRTYKNVPFTDWFQVEPLKDYHRVITAENFMSTLAPVVWPNEHRVGSCFAFDKDTECRMKEGNPFGPFWDGLGIDFVRSESFDVSYSSPELWVKRFPPPDYPVVALKGAPASFPMDPGHQRLHQYLMWSDDLKQQASKYINENFPNQKYIGIHLRNGIDWRNACEHAEGKQKFMASPQCIDPKSGLTVTREMCFPDTQDILRLLRNIVEKTGINIVYVATDQSPLLQEITDHLQDHQVKVFHQDPWLPQLDLYTLGHADYFIGNCVSSFTSFVTRERAVNDRPTSFWGLS